MRETERVNVLSHVNILVYERADRTDMKRSTGMSHPTWRAVNSKGVSDGVTNTVNDNSRREHFHTHTHFSLKTCHREHVLLFDKKKKKPWWILRDCEREINHVFFGRRHAHTHTQRITICEIIKVQHEFLENYQLHKGWRKRGTRKKSHTKLTNLYSMPKLPVMKDQGAPFHELEDLNFNWEASNLLKILNVKPCV